MGWDQPWLAPLSGYTDLPFRLLCREFGAAVACTEMISAKGLIYNTRGTLELLKTCPADQPLVVQLFGDLPDNLSEGLRILRDHGFSVFDLNAACPAPKVAKAGAGSAMLRDPDTLVRAVAALVKAAGACPVGVKLRLGWDRPIAMELGPRLEEAGAAWLTMHPRLGRQGFAGRADWAALAELKSRLSIPLLASGDLRRPEDGLKCCQESGADGLMFARGALSNPAIFMDYKNLLAIEHDQTVRSADNQEKRLGRLIRRHISLCQTHGQGNSVLVMRSFIPRYVKNLENASVLRQEMVKQNTWDGILTLLDEYLPD